MTDLVNSDVYGLGKALRNKVEVWKNVDFDLGQAITDLIPLNTNTFSFEASDEEEVNLPLADGSISEWGMLSMDAEALSDLSVEFVVKVMCSVVPDDDGEYPPLALLKKDIAQLSRGMDTAGKVKQSIEKVLGKGTVDTCKFWVDTIDEVPMLVMQIVINTPLIPTPKSNVRTWMQIIHPQDDMADKVNPRLTFAQAYVGLKAGKDVYRLLGVGDSALRENLFNGLSLAYNVDYDEFYNMWIDNAS